MSDIKIESLGIKAEMCRALEDFNTWPQWAKEIPFENSDQVMEKILIKANAVGPQSAEQKRDRSTSGS